MRKKYASSRPILRDSVWKKNMSMTEQLIRERERIFGHKIQKQDCNAKQAEQQIHTDN